METAANFRTLTATKKKIIGGKIVRTGGPEDVLESIKNDTRSLRYSVMYRVPQTKKNKTWTDDGTLVVSGDAAVLLNGNDQIVSNGTVTQRLEEDMEIFVGGKEVQLLEELVPVKSPQLPGPVPKVSAVRPAAAPHSKPGVRDVSKALSSSYSSLARPETSRTMYTPPVEISRVSSEKPRAFTPLFPKNAVAAKPLLARDANRSVSGKSSGGTKDKINKTDTWKRSYLDDSDSDDDCIIVATPLSKAVTKQFKPPKMRKTENQAGNDSGEVNDHQEKEVVGPRYYGCRWKRSHFKPIWEGDGILIIERNKMTLKNADSAQTLALMHAVRKTVRDGEELRVGSHIVQVSSQMSMKEFKKASNTACRTEELLIVEDHQPTKKAFKPLKVMIDGYVHANSVADQSPHSLIKPNLPDLNFMSLPNPVTMDMKETFVEVILDPQLAKVMRPHQIEGVKFMYDCVTGRRAEGSGCILADEMGLGKTLQAIALVLTLLKQNSIYSTINNKASIEKVMIVCPVSLLNNWADEFKKWLGFAHSNIGVFVADSKSPPKTFANSRHYQVLIIGYERFRSDFECLVRMQPPIGLVICDEGHRLKASGNETSRALRELSTKRRILLSGTPLQNDLQEFHTMIDFVNPNILDSYNNFRRHFEKPILRAREQSCSAKERVLGQQRSQQLAFISKQYIIRRTKAALGFQQYLPPKSEYTVFIMPTVLETELYTSILEDTAVQKLFQGDMGDGLNVSMAYQLSVMTTLRKLSNTPGLLLKDLDAQKTTEGGFSFTDKMRSMLAQVGQGHAASDMTLSGKMTFLSDLLEKLWEEGEEKIVVVSNFTATLDIIEAHCRRKAHPFCRLDGTTAQGDRQNMVKSFNKGSRNSNFVFLLSSKAGGTGLNIIGASRLVLVDCDWNPSNDLQAMARIHRDGQTRHCVLYRLLTSGTIDEKIFQRQITKMGLSDALIEHNAATNNAQRARNAFSSEELRDIFRLRVGVTSETHDLLDCPRCKRNERHKENEAMIPSSYTVDNEYDSSQESQGFIQASQYVATRKRQSDGESKSNSLGILNTWKHHECYLDAGIEGLDDIVLRSIVREGIKRAAKEAVHYVPPSIDGYPGRRVTEERGELPGPESQTGSWHSLSGGQVGFVFGVLG